MNRIVRENFPVADLPEDLRAIFVDEGYVRIVVETMDKPQAIATKSFSLDELFARAPRSFQSLDDVADHIRSIRDEWD